MIETLDSWKMCKVQLVIHVAKLVYSEMPARSQRYWLVELSHRHQFQFRYQFHNRDNEFIISSPSPPPQHLF